MRSHDPIGVFDSGVGGLSILRALRAELPGEDFVYFSDAGHAPYGERGDVFVAERSRSIARELVEGHRIKALVIACNTATAAAVHLLRQAHGESVPVVGVEPALKPAVAITRTRRVAVIGTRVTLGSAKFRALHDLLRGQAEFVVQPCDGLAGAIEGFDEDAIASLARRHLGGVGEFGTREGQIDTLVLGCTHYPFAAAHLAAVVGPQVRMVEPGEPVARQTRRVLAERGWLRDADGQGNGDSAGGRVDFRTTGSPQALQAATARWLGLASAV
jgi:glutamate racemase